MIKRFGGAMTVQECARQVAELRGCAQAAAAYGLASCNVLVREVPVWTWGKLMNARLGHWRCFLTCQRRFASLKKVNSCPETVEINVVSLIAVLGDSFPLLKLPHRCQCPYCGTSHIELDWIVPAEPPPLQVHYPSDMVRQAAESAQRQLQRYEQVYEPKPPETDS